MVLERRLQDEVRAAMDYREPRGRLYRVLLVWNRR